ncbi:MAG: 2-hydroxyacyl-CoA dehydratase family protein [Dehalococcoidia bacterium]|nr:2-hydroxyacyl-CoA dehydratase family protein [Dehalococcoidia bacterium]MDP7239634.1 2-hydroxyacyl-CoA dehydratase family protein [Dehalococcoidia bacterium]
MAVAWETKPLECWGKLRELRRQFVTEMWTAKERGDLLMMGGTGPLHALPAGLGKFHFFGGLGPNFGRIMDDFPLLTKCIELSEQMGYGPDTCSTLRCTLGSMFLGEFDLNPRTGERLKADFLLENQVCQAQGKTAQLWHEYTGVPNFLIEMPPDMQRADYMISQMDEAIEFMQKSTGLEYNDEWLIEAVQNEWEVRVLWAELSMLQKATPAPLKQKNLFSFNTILWRGGRHRSESVDFLRLALAEVQDRVANKIAGFPNEKCRLFHEAAATWYKSPVLSYPERYGAVFIGSHQIFAGQGAFAIEDDGTWTVAPRLKDIDLKVKDRASALKALALLYLQYSPGTAGLLCLENRVEGRAKLAGDYQVNGVVINNDRGCRGTSVGNMESILALKKVGIPVISYEGNVTNPRELDANEYMRRLDSFLESLGLSPLYGESTNDTDDEGGGSGH